MCEFSSTQDTWANGPYLKVSREGGSVCVVKNNTTSTMVDEKKKKKSKGKRALWLSPWARLLILQIFGWLVWKALAWCGSTLIQLQVIVSQTRFATVKILWYICTHLVRRHARTLRHRLFERAVRSPSSKKYYLPIGRSGSADREGSGVHGIGLVWGSFSQRHPDTTRIKVFVFQ